MRIAGTMRTVLALGLGVVVAPVARAQMVMPFHVVPVVVKAAGVAGTDWRSDLSISNLSSQPVTVGLAYFPEKRDNAFPLTYPVTLDLEAGETRKVEDVIGSLFPEHGSNTKGVLLATVTDGGDDARIAVTSRAYNAADPDATYGQTVPSTLLGFVSGQGVSVMTGVQQDARARTNIGVVNASFGGSPVPGPQRVRVRIRVFDASGAIVHDGVHEVEALSLRQWNLERDFGVSGLSAGRVEVSIDPGTEGYDPCQVSYGPGVAGTGAAIIAYYSKVDNVTGDAEFGIGQVDWSAHQADCGEDPVQSCGGSGSGQPG